MSSKITVAAVGDLAKSDTTGNERFSVEVAETVATTLPSGKKLVTRATVARVFRTMWAQGSGDDAQYVRGLTREDALAVKEAGLDLRDLFPGARIVTMPCRPHEIARRSTGEMITVSSFSALAFGDETDEQAVRRSFPKERVNEYLIRPTDAPALPAGFQTVPVNGAVPVP